MLSTILGQAYQRADQQYRNTAKLVSVPVAIALSCAAAVFMGGWNNHNWGLAIALGVIATPLAPIAKDLSSALQTGVQALQSWKGAI